MSISTQTFDVVGMTCDHCARAVGKEIRRIDGVDAVDVDLVSGLVWRPSAAQWSAPPGRRRRRR